MKGTERRQCSCLKKERFSKYTYLQNLMKKNFAADEETLVRARGSLFVKVMNLWPKHFVNLKGLSHEMNFNNVDEN